MKFLLNELNKYVNIKNKTKEEIIDIFTKLAFEVEDIYPAAQIKGAILTKVENCKKHPNADTLSYLNTKIKGEELEVVCGGANIKNGQIVAHAIPGSIVGKIKMAPKSLRGIVSNGMILSIGEIAGLDKKVIEDDAKEDIFVFPENTKLDSNIIELLELTGDVVDLSILPDRQYAASYFTMAREIAGHLNQELSFQIKDIERESETQTNLVLGKDAHSLHVTNVLLNRDIKTPYWIKRILYHAGMKPSNDIEDIVRYSMLMTGAITYIVDRQEEFKLDDRKLNEIDIFNSQALLTENKKVSFVTIGSNKRSNFVNEKNLNKDFGMRAIKGTTTEAALLTSKFILEVAAEAGFIKSASTTVSKIIENNKTFEIEDSYIFNYLGVEFDLKPVIDKLNKIGITKEGNTYKIPSYRKDIEFKADVVEEIARFYGVENIEPKNYKITNDKVKPEIHKNAMVNITNELVKYGFLEAKTYQLITEELAKKYNIWNMNEFVKLREDYSVDYNTLQTSLFNGLLETFKLNHRNFHKDLRFFEIGNVYHNKQPVYTLGLMHNEFIYEQEPILATKELVLKAIEAIKGNISKLTFEETNVKIFNKYVSAKINYDGKLIGLIGEIHPSILRENKFIRLDKIKTKIYYAELQIESLLRE
ncbi:MAG: phenylalanine--tRNA ligase beta subunit [Candidatus Tyloplasma litorale]|nr:MAG: phenylalanine--tRNA ligase beta subunit [Mycoplasmatales bacterium]